MNNETLSINAGAFVVPNHATTFGYIKKHGLSSTYEYLCDLAKLNGIELKDDDKIVEMWFHSKELDCDNMADHGFETKLSNGHKIICQPRKLQWVPAKMLENVKEGDLITLITPGNAYYDEDYHVLNVRKAAKKIDLILSISAVCQQQGYRYKRFGNFEDVVKLVCIEK